MARREPHSSTEPETTGHEWDGITELNKPLPKWWLWTFYATIVWAIGYWLLMPAWPLVSSYTKGYLGYSERERVTEEVAAAKSEKSVYRDRIAAMDLAAINNDPELLSFALAGGEAAFGDNCAPCHLPVHTAGQCSCILLWLTLKRSFCAVKVKMSACMRHPSLPS